MNSAIKCVEVLYQHSRSEFDMTTISIIPDSSAKKRRHATSSRVILLSIIFNLGLTVAHTAFAQESDPATNPPNAKATPDAKSDARVIDPPKPDLSAEIEARKSYAIPALEILGFDFLLNQFN